MNILKKQANGINSRITSRVSNQDESIIINQIIQRILPEIETNMVKIMHKV